MQLAHLSEPTCTSSTGLTLKILNSNLQNLWRSCKILSDAYVYNFGREGFLKQMDHTRETLSQIALTFVSEETARKWKMDGDAVAAAAAVESGRRRLQTIHNHLHSPPSGNPKPFPFLLFLWFSCGILESKCGLRGKTDAGGFCKPAPIEDMPWLGGGWWCKLAGEGSAQLEKQPTAAEFYLGFLSCLKPYFILFLLEVFGHIIIKIFYGKN